MSSTSWNGEMELEEETDVEGAPRNNAGPFEVDHLATFAIPHQPSGRKLIEDGFNKLFEMERTSGVWTMQCSLLVAPPFFHVVFMENGRKSRSERFRVEDMIEPTARLSDDRRDPFNNVFLFVYKSSSSTGPGGGGGGGGGGEVEDMAEEMHLFQCVNCSAKDIVDGVKEAKSELIKAGFQKNRANWAREEEDERQRQMPASAAPAVVPLSLPVSPSASMREGLDDIDVESSASTTTAASLLRRQYSEAERVHHDVVLLNRCFDDVEIFVGKLQSAAEAFKELEIRRSKKKKSGFGAKSGKKEKDLMAALYQRARPPPEVEFAEIFKKFKLCFNLLAKLKAHIHDPNAPELVHFLFTPMSLVVEASKDAVSGLPELAAKIVTPLLLKETVDLLSNCLTSREHQLWLSLGDAWVVPKSHWKGYAPPYTPVFADGWRPNPTLYYDPEDRKKQISSHLSSSAVEVARTQVSRQRRGSFDDRPSSDGYSYDAEIFDVAVSPKSMVSSGGASTETPIYESSNIYRGGPSRVSPRYSTHNTSVAAAAGASSTPVMTRQRSADSNPPVRRPTPSSGRRDVADAAETDDRLGSLVFEELRQEPRLLRAFANRMQSFEEHLLSRGSRVHEAIFDRRSNHVKEITVRKSEVLQVLDDSKQWWKLRNWRGEEGYAPNTILKLVHDYATASTANAPPPPPPPPPTSTRPSAPSSTRKTDDAKGSVGHAAAVLAARGQLRSVHAAGATAAKKSPPLKHDSLSALNDELKMRMSHGRNSSQSPASSSDLPADQPSKGGSSPPPAAAVLYLSQESTEEEVQKWLRVKTFSPRVQQALQGQSGLSLFTLKQDEFVEFFGKEEGTRLDSQLTVQKNLCGYTTVSSYELRAILNHRKSQVEKAATAAAAKEAQSGLNVASGLEAPPDFDPPTPQPSIDGGSLASEQYTL